MTVPCSASRQELTAPVCVYTLHGVLPCKISQPPFFPKSDMCSYEPWTGCGKTRSRRASWAGSRPSLGGAPPESSLSQLRNAKSRRCSVFSFLCCPFPLFSLHPENSESLLTDCLSQSFFPNSAAINTAQACCGAQILFLYSWAVSQSCTLVEESHDWQ